MILETKWKSLAIAQYFTDDMSDDEAAVLYDDLQNQDTQKEVEGCIELHGAMVWEPFNAYTDRHFPNLISSLAEDAQRRANDNT